MYAHFVDKKNETTWVSMLSRIAPLIVFLCPPLVVGVLIYLGFNISLVVVIAVALVICGLMFLQPEVTTMVVLFVLYANLAVVAIRSYGAPELVAASVFLVLILPLAHYLIIDRQPIVINRVFLLMVVYLGACLLSAVLSGQVMHSMGRLIGYIFEGLILYLLIINTVRTPNVLRGAIWTLILAGVLMGSISLYQELTGSYDNDFGGLSIVKETGTINTSQVDLLGEQVERQRLAGPLGSKNRYAQVMVVLLPLALMRVWAERSWILRLFGALSCIPIVAGALLTFSRGAGIAIMATLLAMVFLRVLKLRHFFITLLIGAALVIVAVPDYIYRISTAVEVAELTSGNVDAASGSVRGRATENLAALFIFIDHPILGVGPGQTSRFTVEYGNEVGFRRLDTERRAHNMFLEEMSDTGLVGFAIFMGIVVLTLYELVLARRRWASSHPEISYTIAGLMLAIIAFLITGVFLHLSYVRYYWLILALAGGAVQAFGGEVPFPSYQSATSNSNRVTQ